MNKNIVFKIALLAICTSLVSCNKKQKTYLKYKVWNAYSTENLISDMNYFDGYSDHEIYKNRDKTLRFSCGKNENEGAQLMISAETFINSFDLELPDVTGTQGTISKDNFSVSVAYYMNVSFSNERDALPGCYPDALIPLENYKFRKLNFIEENRNQALYINLKTTKDTPTGEYFGTGKLHLEEDVIDIPFEVTIYDVTMPDEVHQKAHFGLWYDEIANGEKRNANSEMNMAYFSFLLDKRIAPMDFPNEMKTNFDMFIENYVELVVNNKTNAGIRLPVIWSNYSTSKVSSILEKMIQKNINLRGAGNSNINLFNKCYFYIDDEPTASQYETVRGHDKDIYDAKVYLANKYNLKIDYPDIYASLMQVPNVVTREFNEELVATQEQGGIQTWCPQVQHFQSEQSREKYRERQSSNNREGGEHVWWYTCIDPQSPYPNYHLDANLLLTRVISYLQYDYNVEASLFWNVCYYTKILHGVTTPRDLWQDPLSWENCASDGMLVYPGYTFGIKGPITTLRLENLLAGNEEYEYLWMINQKIQEYNTIHTTSYETNVLLNKYYSQLFTNMIIGLDVNVFENVRVQLLQLLEALNHNLDNGMQELLG